MARNPGSSLYQCHVHGLEICPNRRVQHQSVRRSQVAGVFDRSTIEWQGHLLVVVRDDDIACVLRLLLATK